MPIKVNVYQQWCIIIRQKGAAITISDIRAILSHEIYSRELHYYPSRLNNYDKLNKQSCYNNIIDPIQNSIFCKLL